MQVISEVYWDRGAREMNQDSVSFQQVGIRREKVILALVFYGIGGLEHGETASGVLTERMTEWFYNECIGMLRRKKGRKKIERAGLRALYACHEEMKAYGQRQGSKLGTTATILLVQGRKYLFWHSGDTRIYRISSRMWTGRRWMRWTGSRKKRMPDRGFRIKRLTLDHTADPHTLVRCVGSFPWKEPDVQQGRLRKKDVLLLCSDGFRSRVPEEKIGEALQPRFLSSQEQMGLRLKELADYVKRRGEKDNISAVAVKIY